jgi:hypothetical protein
LQSMNVWRPVLGATDVDGWYIEADLLPATSTSSTSTISLTRKACPKATRICRRSRIGLQPLARGGHQGVNLGFRQYSASDNQRSCPGRHELSAFRLMRVSIIFCLEVDDPIFG